MKDPVRLLEDLETIFLSSNDTRSLNSLETVSENLNLIKLIQLPRNPTITFGFVLGSHMQYALLIISIYYSSSIVKLIYAVLKVLRHFTF